MLQIFEKLSTLPSHSATVGSIIWRDHCLNAYRVLVSGVVVDGVRVRRVRRVHVRRRRGGQRGRAVGHGRGAPSAETTVLFAA